MRIGEVVMALLGGGKKAGPLEEVESPPPAPAVDELTLVIHLRNGLKRTYTAQIGKTDQKIEADLNVHYPQLWEELEGNGKSVLFQYNEGEDWFLREEIVLVTLNLKRG